MQIGVVYPQTEFGDDPIAVKDYAQTVEGLGYSHVLAYDHVLGANPDRPGGLSGPYTHESAFMEPLILFTFMASATHRLGFATGIIILPQRQTALAAKQAACLDVLCGGRLRLGVGLGWNEIEYVALNEDFHTRGRRIEEQVEVMRRLWTEPLVTFSGRWHTIQDAGLNPMPVQRPIPIWFGGHADPVLKRVARMGDGWMPNTRSPSSAQPLLDSLDRFLAEAGRSRADIGIEARLKYEPGQMDTLQKMIMEWEQNGATHISVNTMGCGFQTPQEHLAVLSELAREIGI